MMSVLIPFCSSETILTTTQEHAKPVFYRRVAVVNIFKCFVFLEAALVNI
jgi:hypothetical protein